MNFGSLQQTKVIGPEGRAKKYPLDKQLWKASQRSEARVRKARLGAYLTADGLFLGRALSLRGTLGR